MSRPPLPQLELPDAEPRTSPSPRAAAAAAESPRQSGLLIAARSLSDWRRVYREVWLDRERPAAPNP